MSNELLNRNKANVDADLLAAKEEARHMLSDNKLAVVTGGAGTAPKCCIYCGADDPYRVSGKYKCRSCGKTFSLNPGGDERKDMNEAFADIGGLMLDIDGWD